MSEYHELNLPSKLIPYEGVKTVSIRYMKGKDEKMVAGINLANFDKKYVMLLKEVMKGIEPENLTLGDRLYIAIWLTIHCYSRYYPIIMPCIECGKESEMIVDLTKLEKIELPDDFKVPYSMDLLNGEVVNLRLLTVGDQMKYVDYVQRKKEDNDFYKMALTIVDDRSIVDRILWLEGLSTKDIGLIRSFHEKHVHGPDFSKYEYECPHCKEVAQVAVPFRLELLFPDGETIAKFARSGV